MVDVRLGSKNASEMWKFKIKDDLQYIIEAINTASVQEGCTPSPWYLRFQLWHDVETYTNKIP